MPSIAKPKNKIDDLAARFATASMKPWLFWLGVAGVVALRMLVAASQRLFLMPEGSSLDDMLMVRGAMSMVQGGWLGPYTAISMAKNMGYSLWLALWHLLGVNIQLANAGLWLAASGLAALALRPVLPGRLPRLVVFAVMAFLPFSFAYYTMRAYRDAIFQSLCLLVFAGVAGVALRLGQWRLWGTVLCSAGASAGLAGLWLLREDGAVVLVFAGCALALVALWAVFMPGAQRRWAKMGAALAPFVALVAAIVAFSGMNAAHYGVFMVNDLSYGSFPRAYGAMVAVSQAESGYTRYVPVTRQALDKMYDEVPSLALLQEQLQDGPVHNGYAMRDGSGEYGGSFYYALRVAAQLADATSTATQAQVYWQRVTDEIRAAVEEGRLQSEPFTASVIPRWDSSLLDPLLREMGNGFVATATLRHCDPRTEESLGSPEEVDKVATFLHGKVQRGYYENSEQPYYGPVRQAVYAMCDGLVWLYRVAVWPLLALALWRFGQALGTGVAELLRSRRPGPVLLYSLILLGLLLSYVLRLGVAAFMEVASFGIGTYEMYLSGGVPALWLFCLGAAAYAPGLTFPQSPRAKEAE